MLNFIKNILIAGFALFAANQQQASKPLVINELMASNSSTIQDQQGQYDDWIEIYNFGSSAINIGGMYLTDDLSTPTKWRIPENNPSATTIPAHGYLLIWADNDTADSGLHANFKLDAGGEEIGLYDSSATGIDGSTLIDSITFGKQTSDFSYGRFPDAADNWRIFPTATAGTENTGGYLGEVAPLKFSHKRGFYEAPFSLIIATETEGATIFYTIDGSSPYDFVRDGPKGTLYNRVIPITTTTCLRAVAVKSGFKSTNIVTHTYIFLDDVIRQATDPDTNAQVVPPGYPAIWPGGSNSGATSGDYQMDPVVVSAYSSTIKDDMKSIPTVSLVMDKDDWFGSSGIYINESQDGSERVVSMEFIDPNNGDEFLINCAISMQGGVSGGGTSLNRWKSYKLSMRPRFKDKTDDGTPTGGPAKLNYKVFCNSPTESFDTLVLDARLGNVWNYGGGVTDTGNRPWISGRPIYQPDVAQYTRDQFVADIQNALGGYGQHGRHVHLYLNGLYWGLYNLHERPDHRFAAATFGGDADDYDCIKHDSGQIINGTNATFNQMLSIAESGLESNERYQLIQQYLDVDNFIDYLIPNYFVGNYDWGHKNWYATRNAVDPNGRWRFHHWDGEHMLENLYENVTGRDNAGGPTRLHNRLMQNAEYRLLFADHVHRHFFNDGALTPEGATALYQIRLNDVDRAVVGESARWGDNQINRFANIRYMRDPHWLLERDWLLDTYFPNRTNIVLDQFKARGWYPRVDAPVFHVNGSYQHGGRISKDDMFSMSTTTGKIYYTLDGSDPRPPQGPDSQIVSTTLINENATKQVLVPVGPVDDNWKSGAAFNDSAWLPCIGGPGGVGYERGFGYEELISLDVGGQMYNGNTSCYIRIPFYLEADVNDSDLLTLKIRYDDGFIAYLNGIEVARRNFTGTPTWSSSANTSHSDNEATNFENIDISAFISAMQSGLNMLAIQGLNTSPTSSDLLISVELVTSKDNTPINDSVSPGVLQYAGPITLPHSTQVKARVLSGGTWSALNEAIFAIGPVAENLRITEIMYHPYNFNDANDPNEEYIELTNIGAETINLNLVSFTDGIDFTFPNTELAPGEYIVVVENRDAFEAKYGPDTGIAGQYSGKLNNNGERIRLQDAIGQTILDFEYSDNWRSITDGQGFSLTIIDPANPDPNSWNYGDCWRSSAYTGGSPGQDDSGIIPNPGAVVINELLANSPAGAADWIELYNTTETSIDIGGWFLSDSGSALNKYRIAAGTIINPHGYIVFYQDQHFGNRNDPGTLEPFALSANGETVYLSSAKDGTLTGYRYSEDFGPSEQGISFGLYFKSSTGTYNFVSMAENTPGSANSYPKVGPIVINEIMYNPDWTDTGLYTNEQYEYIELYNISTESVNLQGWKFTDGIDFTFPDEQPVMILAGGYLLVVRNPGAFTWRYPRILTDNFLGPYGGMLDNAGERLELSMPGNTDELGTTYYIRIDRVSYSDGSHPQNCPGGVDLWPIEADGGGSSLTRRVATEYGNDVANWRASSLSPGRVNFLR